MYLLFVLSASAVQQENTLVTFCILKSLETKGTEGTEWAVSIFLLVKGLLK